MTDRRRNQSGDLSKPSVTYFRQIGCFTAHLYTAATCWREVLSAAASLQSSCQNRLDQRENVTPTAETSFMFTLTIKKSSICEVNCDSSSKQAQFLCSSILCTIVAQLVASVGLVWFPQSCSGRLLLALVSYHLLLPHCSCLVLDLRKKFL